MTLTQEQIAHIHQLADAEGRLTPASIVADAKRKDSPLHGLFDWNAKAAAERWWLQRAREVIGSVTLQVSTNESIIKTPCYVVDTAVDGAGYRHVTALKSDPASARASLVYTLETAAGHLRRAYDLAGPLGMQAEVDGLLERIVGVQRKVIEAA